MNVFPINKCNVCSILFVWIAFLMEFYYFPGFTLGNLIALQLLTAVSIFSLQYTPFASRTSTITMAVVVFLLGTGVILNTWYFTTALGGTPQEPVLINDDSNRWWNSAVNLLSPERGYSIEDTYGLYSRVLALILGIFGDNVGTALLWSMTLIVISVLLTGTLSWRVCADSRVAVLSMICVAAVCYWLSMGTLILKDAFVIFGMLVGAISFTTRKKIWFFILIGFSILILSCSRLHCLVVLALGALIVGADKKNIVYRLIAVVLLVTAYHYVAVFNSKPSFALPDAVASGFSYTAPQQMAFYNVIGNYLLLPFYIKLLILPITAGVQFLIPFSWTWARDIPFGLTQAWAHFGYPWYIFGFIFVYFLVGRIRSYRTILYGLSVFAFIGWLVPCFGAGGTVSRYGLPFVSLMAPAVAYTILNHYKSRRFYVYLGVCGAVLTVVLIIAHHLQLSAMS